jgi:hypothetical protein
MVHNLYAPAELINQLRLGLSDNLADLFSQRTKRWPHPMMHDECFTLSTFGDLTQNISTDRAFSLIPIALDIALEQSEKNLFLTALSLIMDLAEASKTTELPPELLEKKTILKSRALSLLNSKDLQIYWNSITKWYRLTDG